MATAATFYYATGGRKEATAKVWLSPEGDGITITVNGRDYRDYFPRIAWQKMILSPLELVGIKNATIKVTALGGGVSGQAGAVRHGIAKALVEMDPNLRPVLKKAGYLKRDPRMVERKKYGLKKARRAPQYSKR